MVRARAADTECTAGSPAGTSTRACACVCAPRRSVSEGTSKDGSVVCPWHGSEFALDDGRVLNGPATHNQPCLVVRERDGPIEVKVRHGQATRREA
jgi:nitrite reductase/ring-hydroxylating ferredoxin subunit